MGYFDDPLHGTGALTTALGTHASAVQGVTIHDYTFVMLNPFSPLIAPLTLLCRAQSSIKMNIFFP